MCVTLQEFLRAQRGKQGVYAVCSSHPLAIKAAAQQAVRDDRDLLIEATSNQVNQFGGYTGMRPAEFQRSVFSIAKSRGLPASRIVFGGDHLGPNPWSHLPAEQAMAHARAMIDEYVRAGFTKIHLDASMPCADDGPQLEDRTVATRAAELCSVAERAAKPGEQPIYIIGTEVPPPGGASHPLDTIVPTTSQAAEETLLHHYEAFHDMGLQDAMKRFAAIVVQPGVEFGHETVVDYESERANGLQSFLKAHPDLVFEAHSTDYQKPAAYKDLINDGFSVLKVGPALTFAVREGLFALAAIESELIDPHESSQLRAILEQAMLAEPSRWQRYYRGTPAEQKVLRSFSYSDRIRYYWSEPPVQSAVRALMQNINSLEIPETLLSQYLPSAYLSVRNGGLKAAEDLIIAHARTVLQTYSSACGPN